MAGRAALASRIVLGLSVIVCLGASAPATDHPAPNTVLFSAMMRDLSSHPGFTEAMLKTLEKNEKTGAAILTPALIDHMRQIILGRDWQRLDHFPGWTMREINPTIRVVGHIAGKEVAQPTPDVTAFVDLGPYALDKSVEEDLDQPSTRPGFSTTGLVSPLGDGVVRGDGPNPINAPLRPESQRLAQLMNRLALNGLENTAPATATIGGHAAHTPQELIAALTDTGHTVLVADARYFANFGHLHFNGQDVMAPFWVDTRLTIPGTTRPLVVPVSHTEYEWVIRGPRVNAVVAFYFGIDGKAEFRTTDQLNQAWVLGRHAHEYSGAEAVEVTRLTGRMMVAYAHLHAAYPKLPFGGYYALGVCQDGVAAIEKKMTGEATLFPNTADGSLFKDARDDEINRLMKAVPKDREGLAPDAGRIFGSLPTTDMEAITIPGLAQDLIAAQAGWQKGSLEQTRHWRRWLGIGLAFLVLVALALRRRSARVFQ